MYTMKYRTIYFVGWTYKKDVMRLARASKTLGFIMFQAESLFPPYEDSLINSI